MEIGDIEWLNTKARPILMLLTDDVMDDSQGRVLTMDTLDTVLEEDPGNETVAILFEIDPDAPNSEKLARIIRQVPPELKWVSWLNTPWLDKPSIVVIHQDLNRRVRQEIYSLYVKRTFEEWMELDYEFMFLSSSRTIEEVAA